MPLPLKHPLLCVLFSFVNTASRVSSEGSWELLSLLRNNTTVNESLM